MDSGCSSTVQRCHFSIITYIYLVEHRYYSSCMGVGSLLMSCHPGDQIQVVRHGQQVPLPVEYSHWPTEDDYWFVCLWACLF